MRSARSLPEQTALRQHAAGLDINLALVDAVPLIARTGRLKINSPIIWIMQRYILPRLLQRPPWLFSNVIGFPNMTQNLI